MKIDTTNNYLIDTYCETPFVNTPLDAPSIPFENYKGYLPLDYSSDSNKIILNSEMFEKNNSLKSKLICTSPNEENPFVFNAMMITDALMLNDSQTILAKSTRTFILLNTSKFCVNKINLDCNLKYSIKRPDGAIIVPVRHKIGCCYSISATGDRSLIKFKTDHEIGRIQLYDKNQFFATLSNNSIALFDGEKMVWNTDLPPAKKNLAPWFSPIFINRPLNAIVYNYGDGAYVNPSIFIALLDMNTGKIRDTIKIPASELNGGLMYEYTHNQYISAGNKLVNLEPISITTFNSFHP